MIEFNIEDAQVDDGKKVIEEYIRDDFQEYQKLYNGDHWRSGDGWVGPRPDAADLKDDPNAGEIIAKFTDRVKRQFVSKNVVKEVVSRHVNGVLSRKPDIQIDLKGQQEEITDEQKQRMDEYKAYLRQWLKKKDIMQKLREALTTTLYGERAVLRFFIPNGIADEDGTIQTPENLEQALKYIYVDCLSPEQAKVYEEPDTKRNIGIYTYENADEQEAMEITWVNPETGQTHLKVITEDGEEEGEPLVLHGRLFHYEVAREPLVSGQIKQLQDLLNKNLTMWSANLDWSGFTERMILNGMPPGKWELNDENQSMEYQEEGAMRTGPNQTNYVFGQPTFNDEGQVTGMTNPSVVFREPIDVETFNNTLGASYTSMLEEAKQAHILLNSEATPSGISRREARQDYEDDLKLSKSQVDDAGEWLLETALLLALDLTGSVSNESEFPYEISFNTILKVGALTADENEILIQQVEAKLISVETAMRKMGIDDVEAEKKRIDRVSEHMREIISVLNEMNVASPQLTRAIAEKLIEDKSEFFGDISLDSILSEIEESAGRNAQRTAFMNPMDENTE